MSVLVRCKVCPPMRQPGPPPPAAAALPASSASKSRLILGFGSAAGRGYNSHPLYITLMGGGYDIKWRGRKNTNRKKNGRGNYVCWYVGTVEFFCRMAVLVVDRENRIMSTTECRTCGPVNETEIRRRVGRKGQVILAVHCRRCGRWLMPATEKMANQWPATNPGLSNPLPEATLFAGE